MKSSCLSRVMRQPPEQVLFTDDSLTNLAGATALGTPTHHFVDEAGLWDTLEEIGALRTPSS
ncbi:hypothetical protein [Microbacterium sp. USHLN186]|uniref:hypothetical protein n=1 Tax=Microbacterium sp. USHLN186 TaxID=3081286 RepID=UPI0030189910